MRTGAAAEHTGYFHETTFYGSDDDLLAVVLPFLEGGRDAGEPTLVALAGGTAELVRSALGDADGIDFLPPDQYSVPAVAIRSYRDLFDAHVAAGSPQIRVVGEVPHPGIGAAWDGWARYEAVVNHAFDDLPIWGICPYDTRTTPEHVLDDVARTHRHVATPDGRHVVNDRYEDPRSFLATRPAAPLDPLQRTSPAIDLHDPTPRLARDAVGALPCELPAGTMTDLMVAVSEVVTNAVRHGIPPVRVRAWVGAERVVVTVQDEGAGLDDPFAGLLPSTRHASTGGLGLWIAHQICRDVSLARTDEGFTVRLVAGTPAVL